MHIGREMRERMKKNILETMTGSNIKKEAPLFAVRPFLLFRDTFTAIHQLRLSAFHSRIILLRMAGKELRSRGSMAYISSRVIEVQGPSHSLVCDCSLFTTFVK